MTTPTQHQDTSCAARVEASMLSTLADLKAMYRPWDCTQEELVEFCDTQDIAFPAIECVDCGASIAKDSDIEHLWCPDCGNGETDIPYEFADESDVHSTIAEQRYDYGLSFDFVQPEDANGYWRYQFSWGGPSTELRLYGMANGQLHSAEYWLLDWWGGACRTLDGDALETARVIFQDFADMDMLQSTYDEAMEG